MNKVNEDGTINVEVWVKKGDMMVNRTALNRDDPDHIYHYVKREFGVDPEDYGIENPMQAGNGTHTCPNCGLRF